MDLSRIFRIARLVKDRQYTDYVYRRIRDKFILLKGLKRLKKYHCGKMSDFKPLRDRRLKEIVTYAYNHSEYYRKSFDKEEININDVIINWVNVPFLDKSTIRKESNKMLAVPSSKEYVGSFTTGGSTGQPLGFYIMGGHDPEHQEFMFRLMGYKPGDKILAMDGTLVPDELLNKNIYWVAKNHKDLPYGRMALSSQYLTRDNMHFYVNFLKCFKPDIIRGYPSFIDTIATYINKNKIILDFEIKGIELTSESFYDYQINNIKNAFNTKIFNQYGHAEASVFGYSVDDTLTTYCSPFYGFTEVIGDDGIHVKQGEIGEVVVTGFNNYAMPFIRYRTGDLAEYGGEDCGVVRLNRIFGRTQDYVYTDELEKILLTAIVFGRHYKAFDNINKWQIVQNIPGEIIFKIIKSEDFSDEDRNELEENFFKIARIKTSFEFVNSLPLTPRGKSKLLIQNITPIE